MCDVVWSACHNNQKEWSPTGGLCDPAGGILIRDDPKQVAVMTKGGLSKLGGHGVRPRVCVS